MIEYLRQMAIFARVVDEGSFRGAARALGLPPSRVSEAVSDLEAHLGVTLLYRTTRKSALTNEGRVFYARASDMVESAAAGFTDLKALSLEPAGALRVSLPAFLSSSSLTSAVCDFVRHHPHVALSVSYTDYRVDLFDDGFDVNIRAGWLDDSSMMSRKLSEMQRVLVAGTGYAASRPPPKRPSDLEDWDWIGFSHRSDSVEFVSPTGETVRVKGKIHVEVDSVEALYHFARHDIGATLLPEHLARAGEADGKLVPLLPDWSLRRLGIYAVWPGQSRKNDLAALFVRFLADIQR